MRVRVYGQSDPRAYRSGECLAILNGSEEDMLVQFTDGHEEVVLGDYILREHQGKPGDYEVGPECPE